MMDIHCLLVSNRFPLGKPHPIPFQQNLASVWVQASSSVSRYTQYFNPWLLRLFYRNTCNPGQPSRKTSEMMDGAALGERQSGERQLGRTVKPDLATFLEPLDYAHTWLHTFHLCGPTDFPFVKADPVLFSVIYNWNHSNECKHSVQRASYLAPQLYYELCFSYHC